MKLRSSSHIAILKNQTFLNTVQRHRFVSFNVYVCVLTYIYVHHVCTSAREDQKTKRAFDLELDLWIIMSHMI